MNCFVHEGAHAVGICAACQKATCRACVARESPRLICSACARRGAVIGYEYKSRACLGSLPLVHVCLGVDAVTMRPKIARGVVAVGNVAVGVVALGGVAVGLAAVGGLSIGIALALGGAALGLGLSLGGFAVGAIAVGGAAVGYVLAIGGGAIGPAVIDGQRCDEVMRELVTRWLGSSSLPPSCRRW